MRWVPAALLAVFLVGAGPAPKSAPKAPPAPKAAPAPAPPEPPRFAWPRLQVIEYVEGSEIVESMGVPVALHAVRVKEKLPELIQRFADAFRDGGLYVPAGKDQPQMASGAVMLTAVDPRRRITYTAILQPLEDGTTSMYLGEANHALRHEPSATGDFAALPPGASQVLRSNSESSRTMAFHAPLSADAVDAFYKESLERQGWRRSPDEPGVYTRSGEEVRLVHEPGEGGLRAVVLVYRGKAAPALPPR